MDIQRPSLSDVDELLEMWMALADGQRAYGSHLLVGENRSRIRETISHYVVADQLRVARADELCGFVMFTVEATRYEQNVERGLIENVYVEPAFRGEGVGSALLDAAEELLHSAGVDVIAIEALADNEAAQRLYHSHGYSPHRLELEKRISSG